MMFILLPAYRDKFSEREIPGWSKPQLYKLINFMGKEQGEPTIA